MVIEAGAERVAARVLPIGARGAGLNPIASASTTAHAMSVRVRHGGRDCVAECDDGWGEIIEWGRTQAGTGRYGGGSFRGHGGTGRSGGRQAGRYEGRAARGGAVGVRGRLCVAFTPM